MGQLQYCCIAQLNFIHVKKTKFVTTHVYLLSTTTYSSIDFGTLRAIRTINIIVVNKKKCFIAILPDSRSLILENQTCKGLLLWETFDDPPFIYSHTQFKKLFAFSMNCFVVSPPKIDKKNHFPIDMDTLE
jgi:hypothetical protein